MDHYVPKRRIPVTLWSSDVQGLKGQVLLDVGGQSDAQPTLLDTLNLSTPFLPVAAGDEGRVRLFRRDRLTRVAPARQVLASDLYARGFQEWREERAEVALVDGSLFTGRVWMPLERESQRLSDYLNRLGARFFVLITPSASLLVNALAVAHVELDEGAGAPLTSHEALGAA